MARRLRARQIPFLVPSTPVLHPWQFHPGIRTRFDECYRALARETGVVFVPFERMPYLPGAFRDDRHMTEAGQAVFTKSLAPHVAPLLGPETRALQ